MIEKIIIFVLFLGPLVFFHELGHFLFARLFGVRVGVFSIGFGPKLFKWRWGETEYALSLIPLGGYVKMFGDDPLNKDAVAQEERQYSFTHKGKWARFWIVMGGPVANFILAFVIFFFLLAGGEKVPQIKMGRLDQSSILYERGLRAGDIVTKVNDRVVSSPSDIALESGDGIRVLTIARADQQLDFKIAMDAETFFEEFSKYPPYFRKPIVVDQEGKAWGIVVGDSAPDLTLSLDDLERMFPAPISFFQLKVENDQYEVADEVTLKPVGDFNSLDDLYLSGYRALDLMVDKTADNSAASRAGIEANDVIFSLNGNEVFAFETLRQTLQDSTEAKASISLWRAGNIINIDLQPEIKEIEGKQTKLIGVYSAGEYVAPTYVTSEPKGIVASTSGAFSRTWSSIVKTIEGFGMLLTGKVSFKTIGGPLAIGKVAHDSFNTSTTYFFQLMALISVNLGVINLFPIPVLDGGHIMFILIELVNRGPLSRRKMEIAQQVGLSILLMLMVGAIFNDFSRFF